MPTDPTYFNNIVHMNDGHEKWPTLCSGRTGDTQNTDPEKVNCNKCKKYLKLEAKDLEDSRKRRQEREDEAARKAKAAARIIDVTPPQK